MLDIRFPTLPVAELQRHQACVNALAWAPHSSCHICTAGDDSQALIWDLSSMSQSMDQGLGVWDWSVFHLHLNRGACRSGPFLSVSTSGNFDSKPHSIPSLHQHICPMPHNWQ